jgi:hypothetical protein
VTGPSGTGPPQPSPPQAYYVEDHCALNWRFLSAGLLAPAAEAAALITAITLYRGAPVFWALLAVALILQFTWIARGQVLPYAWPAAMRLDSGGLQIGGVRWAERHPGRVRHRATVPRQYGQVFACTWDGVQRVGVTRDPTAIKTMIRHAAHGRRRTPLGNLAVPFMRAALVIIVDPAQCTLPHITPARGLLSANWSSPGFHQPLWIIPTRHPADLEAALAAVPLPAGTIGDPYPGAGGGSSITDWLASSQ